MQHLSEGMVVNVPQERHVAGPIGSAYLSRRSLNASLKKVTHCVHLPKRSLSAPRATDEAHILPVVSREGVYNGKQLLTLRDVSGDCENVIEVDFNVLEENPGR